MTHYKNRKDSIYFQLLLLLISWAAAAVFMFLVLRFAGEYAVDQYYRQSDYEERRSEAYIEKFQKYINEKELTSRDTGAISAWVKKQKILSIRIYKDGIEVFDSDYPQQELWEEAIEANEYTWEIYYAVQFADGVARVSIFGIYSYQAYNILQIVGMLLSFAFFLLFVLLGIRRKINYILKLNEEIEILEGGRLDYEISVKGRDELAALARGLNNMRISFCRLLDENAKMVKENQKIITEMSHDLRTPVTSILLYTEIIKKGNYRNELQLKEYVEKIDRKAHRMKQLTNHLFEYSLVTGDNEIELEEPESFENLFYDLLSETCSYLEQKGIRVECALEWNGRELRIYTDYLTRIMDNIMSNIVKYADPQQPVQIRSVCDAQTVGFSFENAVKSVEKKTESTCVGIQSIKSMMAKMKETCVTQQTEDRFRITIRFQVV